MSIIDQIYRIERVHQLIRRKSTGPPHEFSARLGISDRQLYRILDELKSIGLPIEYCRTRRSYIYSHEVDLEVSFKILDQRKKTVYGGRKPVLPKLKNWW